VSTIGFGASAADARDVLGQVSEDEVRFYDALANNESAVRELADETLKKIAHELADNLLKARTAKPLLAEQMRQVIHQVEQRCRNVEPSYRPDPVQT
jgi:type I restriction enzyme R subunit